MHRRQGGALQMLLFLRRSGACPSEGVEPDFTFPVASNEASYSTCLRGAESISGENFPAFIMSEVFDKAGQLQREFGNTSSAALPQGVWVWAR